jgi:hypothetical protein
MSVSNNMIAAAVLIVILAFGPGIPGAHAQAFGDCADASYRAQFDPRIEGTPYDCVERLRVEVSTEAGTRQMRLLHDRNGGWALASDALEGFERGVRGAQAALEQIGPFRMDNVTVLLIDGLPPRADDSDGFSNIAASTLASDGECRIAIYLLGPAGDATFAAYVAAHEIFHCVQEATLSPAQMSSGSGGTGAGGDWWIEGSADWFAALALAELGPLPEHIAGFDEVSADTPLYEMAYEAVVFFLWLNDDRGPASILPLLRGMPGRSGAGAQRNALESALSPDDWLRFAQAYIDGDIKHPHGTALSINPSDGDTWHWTETATENITLEPFVIRRGWVEFDCGEWATEVQPAEGYAVRPDGGSWGDLPASIDINNGDASRYRFVGIAAHSSDVDLSIEGEIEAGCQPCAGTDAIDACIVGTWQETGGGPIEWMKELLQRPTVVEGQRRNAITTFESDGTFGTALVTGELMMTAEASDGEVHSEGHATWQTTGRWSAEGGQLNQCPDTSRFQGEFTINAPDGTVFNSAVPTPQVSGPQTFDYTCSGSSLETSLTFPGIPTPMVTQYTRMSAPGE